MNVTFLTWNLALLERSAQAPPAWSSHDSEAAVRSTVLSQEPDIVAFQELPGACPYVETHDMVRSNPATHSGNLAMLAHHELFDPEPLVGSVKGCGLLVHLPAQELTIVNVHLAAGPGATDDRLEQLDRVLGSTNRRRILVIGDTNTRVDELPAIEEMGLTVPELPSPTWDSRRNRFRSNGAAFVSYFTRVFHTPDLTVRDLHVLNKPTTHNEQRFYVSDHYALFGTVTDDMTTPDQAS